MTLTGTFMTWMQESARPQLAKNLSAPNAMYAQFMQQKAFKLRSRRKWVQRQRDDYMRRPFTQRQRGDHA